MFLPDVSLLRNFLITKGAASNDMNAAAVAILYEGIILPK